MAVFFESEYDTTTPRYIYVVVNDSTPERTQEEIANAALIEKAFKKLCDDERPTFVPHETPNLPRVYVSPHANVASQRGTERYPTGFE